jgi:hypothetical protein
METVVWPVISLESAFLSISQPVEDSSERVVQPAWSVMICLKTIAIPMKEEQTAWVSACEISVIDIKPSQPVKHLSTALGFKHETYMNVK